MNAAQLLADLSQHGLQIRADGEVLYIRPKAQLTPVLLAEVKSHKREILEHLLDRRCNRCRELAEKSVETILCSACGYEAPRQSPQPTPEDLVYPLAWVREQVPTLPVVYRERFDYWVDLMRTAGWSQEEAERGAFRRVLRSPPVVQVRGIGSTQLRLIGESE